MTTPITWGGNRVGEAASTRFWSEANPFGMDRILTGGIAINANSATTDYALQLGSLWNFSSGASTSTPIIPTIQYGQGDWISGQNYMITRVIYNNASISLTTATGGVFTAVSAGGTTIVSNAALSALTATTNGLMSIPSLAANAQLNYYSGTTLYFRIGTAQGAAATLDVYIMGVVFP
jgi:hypothetical protein